MSAVTKRDPVVEATLESDARLMERLANGNLSPLGTLYDRYGDHVRHFVLRATGNPSLVDDVTHDAFLGLVSAAPRFDRAYSVRAFVVGIAGKLVLRERRRIAVTARIMSEVRSWWSGSDRRTPEGSVVAAQQLQHYETALARLSEAKRVTIIMADFEGMSGAEIAAALDIPVGTVWTRLHHARAELKADVFDSAEDGR